jgi:GAF domain-containing protein
MRRIEVHGVEPAARERLLIRTLLELADTMVVEHDVVDFLYLLCERAVDVVGADEAGVLLMADTGDLEVAGSSSYALRELEQVEVELRQGPCVVAHRSGGAVDESDLSSATRWPDFSPHALAKGLRSVHARPLRRRGQPIGALTVFRKVPGGFSDDDIAVIAGLTDMASIGIVHERALSAVEQQVSDLQRALDRRAVVDQAMAVLADRLAIDHGLAFDSLRRYARNHNLHLRDVAQRFLNGEVDVDAVAPG